MVSPRSALQPFFTATLLSLSAAWGQGGPQDDSWIPLPQWREEDAAQHRHGQSPEPLGGLLWPGSLLSPEAGRKSPSLAPSSVADPGDTAQPRVDIASFLPPRLTPPTPALPAGSLAPKLLVDTPTDYLQACQSLPAEQHLLDPWHHLAETSGEELEQFLSYHSESSSIRATALLLARGEQLPRDVDLTKLASGALTRARSCLVVLPLGEPWRARIFLSQDVQSSVPPVYLANLAGDCISDAAQAADEGDQLHRFLVRLSTRLFWLERMLPQNVAATASNASPLAQADSAQSFGLRSVLTEITDLTPATWWGLMLTQARNYQLPLSGLAAGLLLILFYRRWTGYRMRHYEWILPDAQPEPTLLGTEFASRVAWLSYR